MQLFDKLCENYHSDDVFHPDPILVGGQMGTWLQYHMAQRNGIVANVNIGRLEKHLWRVLQGLDTYEGGNAQPLNKASLSLFVAHALMDEAILEQEVYAPLKKYLGVREKSEGLYYRKLIQLATQIATVFIDYEFKRIKSPSCAGVIESWLDHDALLFSENIGKGVRLDEETWFGQVEQWQKELYRELFKDQGILDRYAEKNSDWYCSLPTYRRQIFKGELNPESCKNEVWHIFAMSQISLFHRELIMTLSELGITFNVYALNPCADFWEDLVSNKKRERDSLDSWQGLSAYEKEMLTKSDGELQGEALEEDVDRMHPLLAEWGRPGREGVQLWCQATDYSFTDSYTDVDEDGSLLESIQYSLLHRTTDLSSKEQDATLQFWNAPEIKREVETLYDSIVHTVRLHPQIRFHDIAVFVSDLDKYSPIIRQVFDERNREGHERIPFTLIDGTTSESLYAKGVGDIMSLAGSAFTRRDVFNLLENPCIQEATGISNDLLASFVHWADTLHVFRHYDENHRNSVGYAEEYIHTWRMALDRLLLGQVVSKEGTVDKNTISLLPHSDIDSSNSATLSLCVSTIEHLYRDLEMLQRDKTVSEWLTFLPNFYATWLGVPEELGGELAIRDSLYDELNKITLLQKKSSTVPWSLIHEFLSGLLSELPGFGGSYLTGGVTVTSLSPKPPVPYECIYILGLNEGVFPSRMTYSSLDLRGCRREIGDFSPLETDRYLFVELLTSVKKQLVLSYVSQDIKKDEPLQQSSIVSELSEFIEKFILNESIRECHIPLLNSNDALFKGDYDEHLWKDTQEEISSYRVPSYSKVFAKRGHTLYQENTSQENLSVIISRVEPEGELLVTQGQLKKFLENPLVYRMQKGFSLWGDDEDHSLESDEPVSLQILIKGEVIGTIVDAFLIKTFKDDWEPSIGSARSIVKTIYNKKLSHGSVPTAVLGEIVQEELLNGIEAEIDTLLTIKSALDSYEFIEPSEIAFDYVLKKEKKVVALKGSSGYLFYSASSNVPILLVPNCFTGSFSPKHLLAPYAQLLILAQSEEYSKVCAEGVQIWCWNPLMGGAMKKFHVALSNSGAQQQLDALLQEMLFSDAGYNLPFDAFVGSTSLESKSLIKKFEPLGLHGDDDLKEQLRSFAEGDSVPALDASKSELVSEAISKSWKTHTDKEYVANYYRFTKVHGQIDNSLEKYLYRFGALLGVECLKN